MPLLPRKATFEPGFKCLRRPWPLAAADRRHRAIFSGRQSRRRVTVSTPYSMQRHDQRLFRAFQIFALPAQVGDLLRALGGAERTFHAVPARLSRNRASICSGKAAQELTASGDATVDGVAPRLGPDRLDDRAADLHDAGAARRPRSATHASARAVESSKGMVALFTALSFACTSGISPPHDVEQLAVIAVLQPHRGGLGQQRALRAASQPVLGDVHVVLGDAVDFVAALVLLGRRLDRGFRALLLDPQVLVSIRVDVERPVAACSITGSARNGPRRRCEYSSSPSLSCRPCSR